MNRHETVKALRHLCTEVHNDGGWETIPWSPNQQAICLEAIEEGYALFSLYADYVECANSVTGSFRLPLKECTFEKLREETEMGIGFGLAEKTKLTKISERPTSFDLHMSPTTPGAQGPTGGASLPLDRGVGVESLGSMDGMADAGTDKTFHSGGYHSLPVKPAKSGMNVHELTVDHMGTAAPDNKRQPLGTPEYSEADEIIPDKEMGRTNVRGVAVPEWSSAGQINPDRVKQTVERIYTSIQDPSVQMSEEDIAAFREWFEADVFTAENGDEFVQQSLRVRDEVSRVTGWQWNESEEPWLRAWEATLLEKVKPADPKEVDPHELAMGRKVEMEHTTDPKIADRIAREHLAEDPHYYTKLKTIHTESLVERLFTQEDVKRAYRERYGDRDPQEVMREIVRAQERKLADALGQELAPENHRREEMGRKDFRHAIAVIVRDGSKVLLGKAQASDDRDGYWCFPGGGIDAGDGGDPVPAAIREAYEETGLQVTSKGVILTHPDKPTCAFVVCEFADREDRLPEPNEEFAEFAWLDYDIRFETPMKIYPVNKSVLERIPRDALYNSKTGRNLFHVKEGSLSEETALKRQKPNKRAWAVSSNSRRVTTGVNSEPHRRSKTGSSDRTKDRPSDKSVAATQNIKGKKALSSPSAPQDSAEKLHFQAGAKNPRKAAQDKKKELDRVKQGRDPSALKPGDEGTPGKADAEKEGKAAGGGGGGGAAKPSGGAQKPPGGPSMPSPSQAATMPINDLVQAAQAVLAAAGMSQGGTAAPGAAPAPGGKQAPGQANGKPAQATADKSPASKDKKDQQTKAQSPGATTPTDPQQQQQQPGQATPPGQMPQQQGQGPQQGQQPGQSAGAGGINQQQPQPGQPGQAQQPGMQPQQQQAPQQPGMQQPGQMQPQPIQPTQGMAPGQPGINGDMTAPGMQPQGMPAFQARVIDLVLRDRGNAEKCFRWLQALGFQPATPDHTTVQVIANTHEEMFLVQRTAKVFGLEMAGLMPQ